MYNKERVIKFGKYSIFLFFSAIILLALMYLISIFILSPIYGGSIPGKSGAGIFLSIFVYYIPALLILGSFIFCFLNFLMNNPHNSSLSKSYLFFILSIPATIFTVSVGLLLSIISQFFLFIGFVINISLPIVSLIYVNKVRKELNEWSWQSWFILIFCSLFILTSIFVYGSALLTHLGILEFSM